ncbi:hypothetical protein FF38_01250, partial [Lucilia cuprina]
LPVTSVLWVKFCWKKLLYFSNELTEIIMICRPQRSKTPESGLTLYSHATLKLEGNLKDAIDMNLAGNRRALNKNLEAFVRLSTAFCNCDQEVIYEKV